MGTIFLGEIHCIELAYNGSASLKTSAPVWSFPLWGKEYGPRQCKKKWKQLRRSAIAYSLTMRPFYMLICSTSWGCQHSMDAAARCLRRQTGGKTLACCFWSLGMALPTLSGVCLRFRCLAFFLGLSPRLWCSFSWLFCLSTSWFLVDTSQGSPKLEGYLIP